MVLHASAFKFSRFYRFAYSPFPSNRRLAIATTVSAGVVFSLFCRYPIRWIRFCRIEEHDQFQIPHLVRFEVLKTDSEWRKQLLKTNAVGVIPFCGICRKKICVGHVPLSHELHILLKFFYFCSCVWVFLFSLRILPFGFMECFRFVYCCSLYLPLGWIGGYGGGGFIHVPSGLLMCRRSDENSAKYCSAGITRKNLLHDEHKQHKKTPKRLRKNAKIIPWFRPR